MVATGRCIVFLGLWLVVAGMTEGRAAGGDVLADSAWRPLEVAGEQVPDGAGLVIRFEAAGKVAGHGGCNAVFGRYRIDKATIAIGPLASTRKACPPAIMRREQGFVSALEAARLYLRDDTRLTLKDARGSTVLRLVETDRN